MMHMMSCVKIRACIINVVCLPFQASSTPTLSVTVAKRGRPSEGYGGNVLNATTMTSALSAITLGSTIWSTSSTGWTIQTHPGGHG